MITELFQGITGYIIITILGLLVGSFLNVIIYRLPIMMAREEKAWAQSVINGDEEIPEMPATKRFNLMVPRSRCPNCQHLIRWYENIPVISWLILRGRCSECKSKISCRYILVELLTAFTSLLVAIHFYEPVQIAFALIFTWGLIALIFIDEAHQILPDRITLPLMWLGIIAALYQSTFINLEASIIGAIIGYLSLWSIYWIFKLITGKEGMGYGDFKLLACLCAWQSALFLPYILLIAAAMGLIYAISIGLPRGKPMAFGPALAVSGWVSFMYGPYLLLLTGFQPI